MRGKRSSKFMLTSRDADSRFLPSSPARAEIDQYLAWLGRCPGRSAAAHRMSSRRAVIIGTLDWHRERSGRYQTPLLSPGPLERNRNWQPQRQSNSSRSLHPDARRPEDRRLATNAQGQTSTCQRGSIYSRCRIGMRQCPTCRCTLHPPRSAITERYRQHPCAGSW